MDLTDQEHLQIPRTRNIKITVLSLVLISLVILSGVLTGSSPSTNNKIEKVTVVKALEPTPPPGGGCGNSCGTVIRPGNPPLKVGQCEKPKLSVALLVDRSTSVHDYGQEVIDQYHEAARYVVESFYSKMDIASTEFDLSFVVYAFATKSVLQNDRSNKVIVVNASNFADRDNLLKVIDRIHFGDGTDADLAASTSPTDMVRGYNGGSAGAIQKKPGEYGDTNWSDAFLKVLQNQNVTVRAGTHYGPYIPAVQPEANAQVDLAIMLTDGLPNRTDGKDGMWSGTKSGYEIDQDGNDIPTNPINDLQYSATRDNEGNIYDKTSKPVDYLRNGHAYNTDYVKFPATTRLVSVRGIIIQPDASPLVTKEANKWGNNIFAPGNFAIANDFGASLKGEIDNLIQKAMEDTGCENLIHGITPKIEIGVSGGDTTARPKEGSGDSPDSAGAVTKTLTITNQTNGTLDDVRVCVSTLASIDPNSVAEDKVDEYLDGVCSAFISVTDANGSNSMGEGDTRTINYTFTARLGVPNSKLYFYSVGKSNATPEELVKGGGVRYPVSSTAVDVIPERLKFPS